MYIYYKRTYTSIYPNYHPFFIRELRVMSTITRVVVGIFYLLLPLSVIADDQPGNYTDSLKVINEKIRLGHAENNLEMCAQGYYDRARYNFSVHLRDQDVMYDLIESAKIYRYLKNDFGFYRARMALADFYIEEEIFLDEAIKLTAEAYQFYVDQNRKTEQAKAITQLGEVYQKKLDYEKAISYVEDGLKASLELENVQMELTNRLLITRLLGNLGNVEKVIEQGEYIIQKESDLGLNQVSAEAFFLIGSNLMMDDQVEKSLYYLKNAVKLNYNVNDLAYQSNSLLSKAYFALDSMTAAYKHLKIANDITSELYNREKYAMASEIAVKYQSYEKDKEIRALEEDNQLYAFKLNQRTRFFIIVTILLVLCALAVYNYFRLQKQRFKMERLLARQKEEISKQKINELESTLKIKNLQSMVLGQEAERTRIAQDLHDSLGGTLSTLKLQYDALQVEHEGLTDDGEYLRIMGMIDGACNEVRDIARNLKPISLGKLGLTAALKDLVNRYSLKGIMDISLHTHEVDGVLSEEAKLHVYRIIQELLNNALKHADATEIDVQVNKMDGELFIVVEDNGKGFDLDNTAHGLGLGNLQSRVNVLRGEIEIDSSRDLGTSVTVHIPIQTAQFEITES